MDGRSSYHTVHSEVCAVKYWSFPYVRLRDLVNFTYKLFTIWICYDFLKMFVLVARSKSWSIISTRLIDRRSKNKNWISWPQSTIYSYHLMSIDQINRLVSRTVYVDKCYHTGQTTSRSTCWSLPSSITRLLCKNIRPTAYYLLTVRKHKKVRTMNIKTVTETTVCKLRI